MKKSKYNERMITIFDTNMGTIMVLQIAGMITRRIHNFAKPFLTMKRGQHLGFITFGSRVDLLIPKAIKLDVNIGDKVKGGETVIGYKK